MKKKTKTTKKVIKKNTTKKIKKVSSKKKKELIKAIVNPVRYFKVDFGRYGGEVAMGAITKEQFEYWCGKDEELGTYLSSRGFDPEAANKDVPKEAQFDKEFFEFEDICLEKTSFTFGKGFQKILRVRFLDQSMDSPHQFWGI